MRISDWSSDVCSSDLVEKLYAFAAESGAGLMVATHSRYVVDLNRDPAGKALYPGADNTEICPTRGFDNAPLYRDGETRMLPRWRSGWPDTGGPITSGWRPRRSEAGRGGQEGDGTCRPWWSPYR